MAQYETVRRSGAGVQSAQIDEGLRAHMSRVYGLMSFGMVVTGLVAYFIGADLKAATTGQPTTLLSPEMIQTMYGGAFRCFDCADILCHSDRLPEPVLVGIHHEERHLRLGIVPDHGCDWPDCGIDRKHLLGVVGSDVRNFRNRCARVRRPHSL